MGGPAVSGMWTGLRGMAAVLLPAVHREAILADLDEEVRTRPPGRRDRWVAWQVLCIAGRYHAACYHDAEDRRRILHLSALALALVWIVPAASLRMFDAACTLGSSGDAFAAALVQRLMEIWRPSHVTAALAAGLAIGRLPILPVQAGPARWHALIFSLGLTFALHGASRGAAAGAVLVAAAVVAHRNRTATGAERGFDPSNSALPG